MAHAAPNLDPHKRKRDVDDSGVPSGYYHSPVTAVNRQGNVGYINYLPRTAAERLALIQGDADTFAGIIALIGEYEGVLERQESLAANLGAKLTGPRLVRGIERLFDGPIKTDSPQPLSNPISWFDVVSFAKASPNDFVLTAMPDGTRCCQFVCKGVRTEIAEDDWRLISSGALDRFPLEHPFEEDETAELATLDILEQRASVLYKKADEVAARARILHRKLGRRRHDLGLRRKAQEDGGGGFHAASPRPPRPLDLRPSYDVHADLVRQFMSAKPSMDPPSSRSTSGAGVSAASLGPPSPSMASPRQQQQYRHDHGLSGQSGRSSAGSATNPAAQAEMTAEADSRGEAYRSLVAQSTEKAAKGDAIDPPCDRCRRLRLQCVKHLTACQGCTRRHAKCSWKSITDDEVARLKLEADAEGDRQRGVDACMCTHEHGLG